MKQALGIKKCLCRGKPTQQSCQVHSGGKESGPQKSMLRCKGSDIVVGKAVNMAVKHQKCRKPPMGASSLQAHQDCGRIDPQ